MTTLTANQISQLHSNGVYTTPPEHPLFTLETLTFLTDGKDLLTVLQTVSQSPNTTVAASFFMRRYGMFTAMQLVQFIQYEELWQGEHDDLWFGAIQEYGNLTVSTYPEVTGWIEASIEDAAEVVRSLLVQIHTVIEALRSSALISANVLWENVFGFWLWQFHIMLNDPTCSHEARITFNYLKDDLLWEGISSHSRFSSYLNGCEPTDLLNTTVRKTCCLSKDVPGLMQCGFCPLKSE
ncbi:hypothetical protein DVB69_08730 [Sporosarcina sp. BI001-red]|uniref:hypothetical protein n=1 Tax=Sporosarcina sp. BI001-red TaxID=2282866 RepID=UPI000E228722|nr:hypothetical protein [Sporosarcina sp. BI001-red]REB08045.1 hypothetical protein DVB69_08730 [Sporosarcina sp. BI001-red]